MSEFQYYEFVAIDRPLSLRERKYLRTITSRATITSTSLINTYEWGAFKADPHELVVKYFDAFLYQANWGTRRLILRVPSARLDLKLVRQYCQYTGATRRGRSVATVSSTGKHLVLDLWSERETADIGDTDPGSLGALTPIRNELMTGDYRALYLAWQLRVQTGEVQPRSVRAPAAPPKMNRLTGSQQALVDLLHIDCS